MNVFKAVLRHDVFPALGCTEPIAVAYAASNAGRLLRGELTEVRIMVDPGVYKNGFAVTVPNTGGEQGNLIAGVLGALIGRPELRMEILKEVSQELLDRAQTLIRAQTARITCDKSRKQMYIEVFLRTDTESARAVITDFHTHLVRLEYNGKQVPLTADCSETAGDLDRNFKLLLRDMNLTQFIDYCRAMDERDYEHIKHGVAMNMRIAEAGRALHKVGYYTAELVSKGYRVDDVFSACEILTASAADARMAGLNLPVMSSGGSGNQGIVAILVPYLVGRHYHIDEPTILQSIALSHLVNSYIKCFTGELSPLCGCAIAAGVGAAVAIVYQQADRDMAKITLAVNSLISDLGGMLCDGAKSGCALKVATSTSSAIRSAYMALNGHGIGDREGFVGNTAEETIQNLSSISKLGMSLVDDTMLQIMIDKDARREMP